MRRWWPELALLGVAAGFAFSFAGGSIWLDEAFSAQVAGSGWARFLELVRQDNGPPLYYALLKGWIAVAGDGERPLRALSALLVVGAVGPAIALGRELGGGSRAAGMAGGLLFACSAQLALHGRSARMYALVMLLAALATWLWARWVRAGAGARVPQGTAAPRSEPAVTLAGFALVTALGAYTHYWFAFLTFAQLLGAAVVLRRRAWPLLAAAVLGWAPFVAWAPSFLAQLSNGSRAWIPPPGPWAPFEAFAGVLGRPATISLAGLIALLRWRQRPQPTPALKAALVLVAAVLLIPSALSLWRPVFWPVRHAAVAVPVITALLGAALAQLLQPRPLAALLSGVLALRIAMHVAEGQLAERREPDSDRGAAAYLRATAAPGDAVILVGLSRPAITYYLRDAPLDLRAFPAEMDLHPAWIDPSAFSPSALDTEAAALDAALRDRPVWLISTGGDPVASALRARLAARPLDHQALRRGLFFDRLERFLPLGGSSP